MRASGGQRSTPKEAGITKPILYDHFSSKKELYLALLDEDLAELHEKVREALDSPTGNRERIRRSFQAYFEFEHEQAWWGQREENPHAWKVSVEQIREGGYNLDIKNPHQVEEENKDPDVLLAEYRQVMAAVGEAKEALKRELRAALERNA